MYSIAELAHDFRAIGVQPGDTVMLHASVRAVGEVAGGPDSIHLALKSALTDEGTLMMYASCPKYYDEIGRGDLTPTQELELHRKPENEALELPIPRDGRGSFEPQLICEVPTPISGRITQQA
jgi:Aminoglycoside 3-N-acetyltransferase